MIIPYQHLPQSTLQALLEEFITREGTDYGEREIDLATKVAQLLEQLKRGEVVIVFDPALETTSLVAKREAEAMGLMNG
ncbi:YheU family protein [Gilvimarinus sp. DA14]|uniref:YheU family protein n=1 Tax=Gilvimarinus sp. DA14 TaxID=2956798 RepID=UPI0020B6A766|nr:YheU family protein [Gilvimarinus sp. DA14]UTF61384.1 YheU family protein [Gilvimarinus sp. DA14]